MFPEQIVYQIEQMGLPKYSHIVFSGGEPMVQQTKLLIVMKMLKQNTIQCPVIDYRKSLIEQNIILKICLTMTMMIW